MTTDRRGTVARTAQELRSRMTDEEREAMSRLYDLGMQTADIEPEAMVVLQRCRNFLGYIEMALFDGNFAESVGWFVDDTNGELDALVAADTTWRAYADDYRALQARCVDAYKRLLAA